MGREEMNKNSLEEAARRTCEFEETAQAGIEMANDPEILAAMNTLQKAVEKYNRYFIFYTHRFEQFNGLKGNILITPSDKRFDRIELLGLVIDIIHDYAAVTGWTLKGSKELGAVIEVLKDIYKGKIYG